MPKLMHYQCRDCGKIEVLWNSRDRVTPFMMDCLKCAGTMQHVGIDIDAPKHVPHRGQRVFIDMPESLKAPAARFMLKGQPTDEAVQEAISWSFPEDAPWVIVWPYGEEPKHKREQPIKMNKQKKRTRRRR